jgi:hypothetical protein
LVQIDLSGHPSIEHFKMIETEVQGLDVSVVIANAGLMNFGSIDG